MSYSQRRRYSNDSHPSDRNDAAGILSGYANTSTPAADDPFDDLRSLHDVSGDCTPGAGHLGYRDASDSDVDRAIKLVEKFEEGHYQQLKRVTCHQTFIEYNLISPLLFQGRRWLECPG
jgi:hypothetical protein